MSGSAILTNNGLFKIASASPLDQLTITQIAVGDGTNPLDPTATTLVNEVFRDTASAPIRSTKYPDTLIFELNIPPTTGGFTTREIGAFDSDGDLIAVGTLDEVVKPNDGINLTVRINVKLANSAQVDVFYDNVGAISLGGLNDRKSEYIINDDGSTVQQVANLVTDAGKNVTLSEAVSEDAFVGTKYVITDRENAPFIVVPVAAQVNGYTRIGMPSGRVLELNTKESINVKWCGAVGDGVNDDKEAIESAYTFRLLKPSLTFTEGSYAVSDGLNLGSKNRSEIIFNSGAELVGTGIGTVLSFDGSASPGGVYGCRIINPRVRSTGDCQTGFLFKAFQHFYIENPEARDVINTGMLMQWCIEGTVINYGCSSNRGAFSVTPISGLIMEERNTGEYCAGVKFTSIAIEGVSGYGIVINDGCRTNTIQGTSEGNTLGGLIINRGQNNTFDLFCEANGEADVRLKSDAWGNTFENGIYNSSSNTLSNIELEGATNNLFKSSFIRSVNSRVEGKRNTFINVSVPDGSQGFLGVGDYTNIKIGCYRVDVDGNPVAQVTDKGSSSGSFLPVIQGSTIAGSVTYNVRNAEYTIIGNICNLTMDIRMLSKGGATGNLQIAGSPFGNNSSMQSWSQLSFWTGIDINDARTQLSVAMEPNSNTIQIYESGDSIGPALISMLNISDNAEFRFSIQYPISLG